LKHTPPIISTDPFLLEEEAPAEAEPGGEAELREFTIDTALHGQRLDRALAQQVPEFSEAICSSSLPRAR
jgi:23S rRNA pseudouridine1911/1915/1917 synthase